MNQGGCMTDAVKDLLNIAIAAISTFNVRVIVKFADLVAEEIWKGFKPAIRASAGRAFKSKVAKNEINGVRFKDKAGKTNTYIIEGKE